jgi:hypothetical protein
MSHAQLLRIIFVVFGPVQFGFTGDHQVINDESLTARERAPGHKESPWLRAFLLEPGIRFEL